MCALTCGPRWVGGSTYLLIDIMRTDLSVDHRTRWSSSSRRSPPSSTWWCVSASRNHQCDHSVCASSHTQSPADPLRPPKTTPKHPNTGLLLHPLQDLPPAIPRHSGLRHHRHACHHYRGEAPRRAQFPSIAGPSLALHMYCGDEHTHSTPSQPYKTHIHHTPPHHTNNSARPFSATR